MPEHHAARLSVAAKHALAAPFASLRAWYGSGTQRNTLVFPSIPILSVLLEGATSLSHVVAVGQDKDAVQRQGMLAFIAS